MADNANASVAKPSAAYSAMAARWDLIDDLLGGTEAMRKAGTKWLPMDDRESHAAYQARLGRSYLYGALRDTIEKFASKPFSKWIILKDGDKLSPELQAIETNADMLGSSLTDFARELFRDGLAHGLSFLFVDYSRTATVGPDGVAKTPNVKLEGELGARPYFQHFHSSSVIGAKCRREPDGSVVPIQVRVKETRMEDDGPFGEKAVNYVRVYDEGFYQEWRQGEDGSWTSAQTIEITPKRPIPIVPFYISQEGFFYACPPFQDLAWENVAHWQSASDQNWILHHARVPILFWSGCTDEEKKKDVEIGPTRCIKSEKPESRMTYVEPVGAAIGAGETDLQRREERMGVLGLAPATERVAQQTATGKEIDDSNAKTSIQSWIRGLESVFERGYEIAASLRKETLPEGFGVVIHKEFDLSERAAIDLAEIRLGRAARDIDQKTYLHEIKRRGTLDPNTDIEAVIEATKAEGPALGNMKMPDPFGRNPPPPQDAPPEKKPVEEGKPPATKAA